MIRGQNSNSMTQVGDSTASAERGWQSLLFDVLEKVAPKLDVDSLQKARLVCQAWKQGLSQGVRSIRPRFEANALGLQWSEMGRIQAAFPMMREIDVRHRPPPPCKASFFSALPGLQKIYLSSVQRPALPREQLAELDTFAKGLQVSNPSAVIDLELRFGESVLLWTVGAALDADPDADIRSVSQLPSNVQVTTLHVPQLCYAISASGLDSVMRLTHLRHLRLVTYGAHLTDADFECLGGLSQLEHLWFGVVPFVSDAGFLAGLGGLKQMRELSLYDVSSMTDVGVELLVDRLEALEGLSLSKCHRLTDKSLASLARLPQLTRLFLSENEYITCAGASLFPDGLKSLAARQCPNLGRSDVYI